MFTYSSATSPVFTNAGGTSIDLTVVFDHLPHSVPFSASPTDIEAHGVELYNRAIAGDFGPIADYVEPAQP